MKKIFFNLIAFVFLVLIILIVILSTIGIETKRFNNLILKKIKLEEVLASDEAFFTGTDAEVVPINSIDNKVLGNGSRGPITKKLQSTYFDQVRGLRKENANWHTFVSE